MQQLSTFKILKLADWWFYSYDLGMCDILLTFFWCSCTLAQRKWQWTNCAICYFCHVRKMQNLWPWSRDTSARSHAHRPSRWIFIATKNTRFQFKFQRTSITLRNNWIPIKQKVIADLNFSTIALLALEIFSSAPVARILPRGEKLKNNADFARDLIDRRGHYVVTDCFDEEISIPEAPAIKTLQKISFVWFCPITFDGGARVLEKRRIY
jgi:hypothetical protein